MGPRGMGLKDPGPRRDPFLQFFNIILILYEIVKSIIYYITSIWGPLKIENFEIFTLGPPGPPWAPGP